MNYFNVGDEVIAETATSQKLRGHIVEVLDDTAEEYQAEFNDAVDNLYEYWKEMEYNTEVNPEDPVVTVDTGEKVYDFPTSKLEIAGENLGHDDEVEQLQIYECAHCEKTWSSPQAEFVEGDSGELYCSMSCLNEAYL